MSSFRFDGWKLRFLMCDFSAIKNSWRVRPDVLAEHKESLVNLKGLPEVDVASVDDILDPAFVFPAWPYFTDVAQVTTSSVGGSRLRCLLSPTIQSSPPSRLSPSGSSSITKPLTPSPSSSLKKRATLDTFFRSPHPPSAKRSKVDDETNKRGTDSV